MTEVLSPAFDADTLFYEVNVTSLTYSVDASASSDGATGLKVNGKAAPAIYTVHSTAPAYQENRVLVSARDATTKQPTSCTPSFSQFRVIVTLIPVMLSTAPVCVHGVVRSSCNAHCPGSMPCHDRGDVRHASGWGCVCNETFGGPNCNVRRCPHCLLHSLCLEKAQTSTLNGRASL